VALGAGHLSPAVRYIEEHLGEPLCNSDLAALCHLCPGHFIRAFRHATGQAPAQYILERRVAVAAQCLALAGENIERVADQLGFANRFHFSRAFARLMGVPPAAYRRSAHAFEPRR
jgi:AraC-like DNA-binding protein